MHRAIRRASNFNTERIDHIYEDPHAAHRRAVSALRGDLTDTIITVRNHPRRLDHPTAGRPDPASVHDLTHPREL